MAPRTGQGDAADFGALPLESQLDALTAALATEDPRALLQRVGPLRDHAPLAWLASRLLELDWYAREEHRVCFAQLLATLPETAVHKTLKALATHPQASDPATGRALSATLSSALDALPVARIATMCVVDRALRQHDADAWEHRTAALIERCASALRDGRPDAVTPAWLAQVPARGIETLAAVASAAGPEAAAALGRAHRRLAAEAIAALGTAPKALSQANAEELLSRRVYTDPGHFLIELLQNAEDSGATSWRVVFSARRIVVWHDGALFDARDLVGVTSIGQTTKRRQQIGFFGVGFKSVYEITDRPQIYSGVYELEIADVSIPRALSGRPAELPQHGTVLVLPLRNPADPSRSPRSLYEKARALDPCVLFTLRSMRAIEFELAPDAGGPLRHAITAGLTVDGLHAVRHEPEGWTRAFMLQDDEYRYDGGHREPGRPDSTRVVVGIAVDAEGTPRPLPSNAPTVYSYLPTAEHSGLRFFVQGHFDVPVDRERIAPDSSWNRWILSLVPGQLARIARRVGAKNDPVAARGFVDVLPVPGELGAPAYHSVVQGLGAALRRVAFVPCTDGRLHAPFETLVASARIAALFSWGTLDGSLLSARASMPAVPERLYFADVTLPGRGADVLRSLRSDAFDAARLLEVLERALSALSEGERPASDAAPDFLREHSPARAVLLYDVLLEELERLERAGADAEAQQWLARLRLLPLVPDASGGLRRPTTSAGDAVARASAPLRDIYGASRAFVHPDFEDGAAPTRVTALLDRLGVPRLDTGALVTDLERALARSRVPLDEPDALPIASDAARLDAALRLLAASPWELQVRAAALPLFLAQDGKLYPAARDVADLAGVLSAKPDNALRDFYGLARPIVHTGPPGEAAAALLDRLAAPSLSIETLVHDLARTPPLVRTDAGTLRSLHALLESLRGEMPARAREALALLPVWPDRRGVARPLRGPGAALVAASDAVTAFLPDAPFLDADVAARAHVESAGPTRIDADAVAFALAPDAAPPLRIEPTPGNAIAALAFLAAHADSVGARARERLATLAAFPSDTGEVSRLDELFLASSPAMRALYGHSRARKFVEPGGATHAALGALGLAARVRTAGVAALADDLAAVSPALRDRVPAASLPLVGDRAHLDAILAQVASEAAGMPRALAERFTALPIFPDAQGRLGALGDLRHGIDPATCYACDPAVAPVLAAAGLRTLDDAAHALVAPLLVAAGVRTARVELVVEVAKRLPRLAAGQSATLLQSPANLASLHALLVSRREELAALHPPSARAGLPTASPTLAALNIWRTAGGAVVHADDLVDAREIVALTDPATPERLALDAVRLEGDALAAFDALAPLVALAPPGPLLARIVTALARPLAPLSQQPRVLSTVERVLSITRLIGPPEPDTALTVPLVDARSRLRLGALRDADADTRVLLEPTPLYDDLIHAGFELPRARAWSALAVPVSPREVLTAFSFGPTAPQRADAHPALRDPARRACFYRWLVAREREVFSDPECRAMLSESRLFPTDRGTLLAPHDLVLDPDVPELGVDWRPAPEIPAEVLELLARHLGAGRASIEQIASRHVVPAYQRAVESRDGAGAAAILTYLSRTLAGRPADAVRALLRPAGAPDLRIEAADGSYWLPEEMVLPSSELAPLVDAVWAGRYPTPSPARFGDQHRRFLLDLGVQPAPVIARVREALERPGGELARVLALAGLVGHLHRQHGARATDLLPLRTSAWIADGTGGPRRPSEIFLPAADTEAIVGAFPELYPHPRIVGLLGDALFASLGLRTARNVRLDEVVHHIETCARAAARLPFRVYQWLEEGLRAGQLDPGTLTATLGDRTWVDTGGGQWFEHRRVLGTWAVPYFGERRGYWERGRAECPRLCALFQIPDTVTPRSVTEFLQEIAAEVVRDGDRAVLARDGATPRMLLACYALLGRAGATVGRALPIVLCTPRGRSQGRGRAPDDAVRLLPAETVGLVRSDTPTLEALFEAASSFHLAARGPAEEREAVDRFYQGVGVRRLRDAYRVVVDRDAGRDCTTERTDAIQSLRGVLRALLHALPRVRARRLGASGAGWVYDQRLRPLASAATIRAVESLRVRYVLDGVGEVLADTPAVFDRARGELLVDAAVFDDYEGHSTGLAVGLMACVYDGPGDDQLADIVEILLRLQTRERMAAYLDRRHFPAVESPTSARDRLAERVGEILDYGLERRLARRFPALHGKDTARWRSAEALAALPTDSPDRDALARRAALLLLEAVGIESPDVTSPGLSDALAALLAAPSLSALPAGTLAEPAHPVERTAHEPMPDLAALIARISEAADTNAVTDAATPPPASRAGIAPSTVTPSPSPEPVPAGVWRKLMDFFGLARPADQPGLAAAPLPSWALDGANVFSPSSTIGPQLWATPAARRRVASARSVTWLAFAPGRLPPPYLYAIHSVGATFEASTQTWHPTGAPPSSALTAGRPSGRTVAFRGRLAPGVSRLPVPMFARIAGVPRVIDRSAAVLEPLPMDASGGYCVNLRAEQPVAVAYDVELLEPPAITGGAALRDVPASLLAPTLAARELPAELRRWIDAQRSKSIPDWAGAVAAEDFIRRHYAYDDAFMDREDVRRTLSGLERARGNHHLALLHAGRSSDRLGRGICYELNVLVAEVLRHLGIPSMIATGWALDLGRVDRPDHLFALALVPSAEGPCLMPLDVATGAHGPFHALSDPTASNVPDAALHGVAAPAVPAVAGPWVREAPHAGPQDGDAWLAQLREAETLRVEQEVVLLSRAVRMVCMVTNTPEPAELAASGSAAERARALRSAAERLLRDPELVGALVALLRGDYQQLTALPPRVQELVALGLAQVRTVPAFQVVPTTRSR